MELLPLLSTGLAGASVPLIGFLGNYIIKRTPNAVSPSEVASTTIEYISKELEKTAARLDKAYDDIEEERESRRKLETDLNSKISKLNSDVEKLWNSTVVLKRHVVRLETVLDENSIAVPIRPPEVEALFS